LKNVGNQTILHIIDFNVWTQNNNQNIVFRRKKIIQVWKNPRECMLWQNFHFWMKC